MAWNFDTIRELAVPVFGEELLKKFETLYMPVPWASNKLKPSKEGNRNFLHGRLTKEGVFVVYFFDKVNARVVGLAHFGKDTEGPAKRVHGGAILTVLDEAIGVFVGFVSGSVAVTRSLDVQFKKFIPLDSICFFTTRVMDENDRDMQAEISLVSISEPPVVHAIATGNFFKYRKVQQVF
jgi:acyl-coenzyme A thioesterase PaaI-like protein